ncbi:hypothetical protein PG996_001010 [Apiospora saccharicola]|uniref:Uncharacterized protein n=1 Tax=Apiospora saccharicola TaxID=335842 RepID=A0ABR1WFD4_9PEZI
MGRLLKGFSAEVEAGKYFVRFTKADMSLMMKDVILLRDRNAWLLGYPSHTFGFKREWAKTPEWVHRFLDTLQDVLLDLRGRT